MAPAAKRGALQRLAILERIAAALRRAGLGRAVDAAGRRLASSLGTFELEVDGLKLGGDHVGQLYYARELLDGGREGRFLELLLAAVRPGSTVLEGGAHIGYVTLQAARAVGPTGRVLVFEPNPRVLPALRANISRNGFDDRVDLYGTALGTTAGKAAFHVTAGGDTSSLHRPPGLASDEIEVAVAAADDVLPADLAVDVVKLDVEGNEVAALQGMKTLLRRNHATVFAECNPSALAAAGSSVEELLDELERLDLLVHWIDEDSRTLRPLHERWLADYVNLVATPRGAATQ